MADGLNKVMLLGNLGADPELRVTPGGQAVLKLRVATSETYLDRNKARQEKTEWHRVVIWGKRAEALNKILAKGTRLFIEGALRTSSYDDRDGNKRYQTEIVASNVILAGRGGGGGGGSRDYDAPATTRDTQEHGYDTGPSYDDAPAHSGSGAQGGSQGGFGSPDDDDIPF
ncbi:MAG TPA: single-stranded DNA-binding protein [Polyangiaceae bacterium]|jgi:single-strand DNA-binding protein|nr:single-stranded DNA-binding protein [Polyangiaceae bacterium]